MSGGGVPEIVNIELFFFLPLPFFKFPFLRWENKPTLISFPLPSPPSLALIPRQGRKKQLVQSLGKSTVSSEPRVGRRHGGTGRGGVGRGGGRGRRAREAAAGPQQNLRLNGAASATGGWRRGGGPGRGALAGSFVCEGGGGGSRGA